MIIIQVLFRNKNTKRIFGNNLGTNNQKKKPN